MSDVNASGYDEAALPAWRERKNLILAGAVGAAVLLLAGYFLLFSGGSEEEFAPIPSAAARGGAAGAVVGAGSTASPSAAATTVKVAVYDEDVYGDPFAPLYPPKAEPAATAASAPAPTVGTGAGSGAGVPIPEITPVEERSTEPAVTKKTVSVKLVRVVDDNTVVVLVNGSKDESTYNKGTVFGGYFWLLSTRVDENEATFGFGDGSPFSLSAGETQKYVVKVG